MIHGSITLPTAGSKNKCTTEMLYTVANVSMTSPGVMTHYYTDPPLTPQTRGVARTQRSASGLDAVHILRVDADREIRGGSVGARANPKG